MSRNYVRTVWVDEQTPVDQEHMNNIEEGIVTAIDAINEIITEIGEKTDSKETDTVYGYINNEIYDRRTDTMYRFATSFDTTTGIALFEFYNIDNTKIGEITLALGTSQLIENMELDYEHKRLVLTMANGNVKYCDLSYMIDDYLTKISNIEDEIGESTDDKTLDTVYGHLNKEIYDRKADTMFRLTSTFDNTTGVVTFTFYNINNVSIGTTTVDLGIDELLDDVSLDYPNQKLILSLADGTTKDCDLSTMINDYLDKISNIEDEIGESTDDKTENTVYGHLNKEIYERQTQAVNNFTYAYSKTDGNLTLTLRDINNATLATETFNLGTEKLIKQVVLDNTNQKIIFTCEGIVNNIPITIECNLSALYTKIANDIQSAKNELNGNINDAETRLNAKINSLDLTEVGSNGNYIKLINQTDGQVSATKEAFDTDFTSPTDNNAPTTQAVKDYVDNLVEDTIEGLDVEAIGSAGSYIKIVSETDGIISATPQQFETTIGENPTDNNAPTTKAVKDLVKSLDVASQGGNGKYIRSILEEDGKISATPQDFDTDFTNPSNNNAPTTQAVKNLIDSLDANQVGQNGYYIKTVSEENGVVTATKEAFETSIPSSNPSEVLAPTVKAVKDYVDSEASDLQNQITNNTNEIANYKTGIEVIQGDVQIKHNAVVEGDLTVRGTTTTADQETIQTKSTIITTNSENGPLVDFTGLVALKGTWEKYDVDANNYEAKAFYYLVNHEYILDESTTYTQGRQYFVPRAEAASLYCKDEDSLLLGEGIYKKGDFIFTDYYRQKTLTSETYVPNTYYILNSDKYYELATGSFDPNETYYEKIVQTTGENIATRDLPSNLTDDHLLKWDAEKFMIVDSGKTITDILNLITAEEEARIQADSNLSDKIQDEIEPAIQGLSDDLSAHELRVDNPHSVTKTQVGLGNVDNTSDATKNSAVANLENKTIDCGTF